MLFIYTNHGDLLPTFPTGSVFEIDAPTYAEADAALCRHVGIKNFGRPELRWVFSYSPEQPVNGGKA